MALPRQGRLRDGAVARPSLAKIFALLRRRCFLRAMKLALLLALCASAIAEPAHIAEPRS